MLEEVCVFCGHVELIVRYGRGNQLEHIYASGCNASLALLLGFDHRVDGQLANHGFFLKFVDDNRPKKLFIEFSYLSIKGFAQVNRTSWFYKRFASTMKP